MNEKTKRILCFTTAYLPHIGGAELALSEITRRIPTIAFDIMTPRLDVSSPAVERNGNICVYRIGPLLRWHNFFFSKLLFIPLAWYRGWRLYRTRSYSAVFALQASQGAIAAVLCKLSICRSLPLTINIQEGKQLDRQWFFIRIPRAMVLRCADTITVISHYLKTVVQKSGTKARIVIIPNGVDIEQFGHRHDTQQKMNIRKSLKIPPDAKIIISASRLVRKNGLDILIKAFAGMSRSDCYLVLVGDGEDRAKLEMMAHSMGCADRVVFVGSVANMRLPLYLQMADIFVRPSRSEGLGTAFLEAMAARVPVIGTPVGGIVDFLKHGETGILVPPENALALKNAIEILLNDAVMSERIVANAAQLVAAHYTWDSIAKQYQDIFERRV